MESPRLEHSIQGRIAGLDELRGIAILLVLVAHFFHIAKTEQFRGFELGAIGVDLFFIISGYLIAKILLGSRGKQGYFRKFYVRRLFRILPLYLLVVATVITLRALRGGEVAGWPFYATFTQNFLFDSDYGKMNFVSEKYSSIPGLGPLWSLSIEEHFYLIMPLLIACLPSRLLPWAFLVIAFAGIGLSVASDPHDPGHWLVYSNERWTWLRMQYLAFGVLLNFPRRWIYLSMCLLFWLGAIAIVGCHHQLFRLGICLVLLTAIDLAIHTRWYIRNPWLAKIGVLCFGIYVLHLPLLFLLRPIFQRIPLLNSESSLASFIQFAVFVGLSIVVASLSFRFFEMPIQRKRTYFES